MAKKKIFTIDTVKKYTSEQMNNNGWDRVEIESRPCKDPVSCGGRFVYWVIAGNQVPFSWRVEDGIKMWYQHNLLCPSAPRFVGKGKKKVVLKEIFNSEEPEIQEVKVTRSTEVAILVYKGRKIKFRVPYGMEPIMDFEVKNME
jgi:hypothetical protein